MDSGVLMNFIQSLGVSEYDKAKELSNLRNRDELIRELLKDSGVSKKYKRESDIKSALESAGLYYKF